jgi:hypothetical protein
MFSFLWSVIENCNLFLWLTCDNHCYQFHNFMLYITFLFLILLQFFGTAGAVQLEKWEHSWSSLLLRNNVCEERLALGLIVVMVLPPLSIQMCWWHFKLAILVSFHISTKSLFTLCTVKLESHIYPIFRPWLTYMEGLYCLLYFLVYLTALCL